MRTLALTVFAAGVAFPRAAASQENELDGRWVARGVPISYHIQGAFVDVLVYPPAVQLARYRISFNGVEVVMSETRSWHTFVVQGDTLDLTTDGQRVRYYRLGTAPDAATPLVGSWRTLLNGVPVIQTYRSDGDFVLEVAAREPYRLRGDTLIATVEGKEVFARLLRSGRELRIQPLRQGSVQRLERRPWGCYGHPQYDKQAKECK